MTKIQQWVAIAAVAVLAILAAGWFFAVSPQRKDASALHVQTAAQQDRTAALRTQLSMLQEQSKQLPAKQAELAKFGKQIPSNPALPTLIRSLTVASASAGVDLVSIAPLPPAVLAAPVPAAVVPAPGTPAKPATTTLAAPAATAPGLQSINLVLKVNGTYAQIEQFLANLEGLQRVLLVNGYSLTPSTGGPSPSGSSSAVRCTSSPCLLDLDLTGQVFTVPAFAAVPAPLTVK